MDLSTQTNVRVQPGPVVSPANAQQHGAQVCPSPWGKQVLRRLGNPPLRFNGRRLSYHWRVLGADQRLEIALWERRQKGYVLGLSRLQGGDLRVDAVQFKTLGDATDFLEDMCQTEPASEDAQDHLLSLLLDLHLKLRFAQQFAILVGDVLADWEGLHAPQSTANLKKEPFQ